MNSSMTLEQVQEKLNNQSHPGIMDRDLWEKSHFQLFEIKDERFYIAHLLIDYKIVSCDQNSQVDIKGYIFSVWADRYHRSQRLVKPGDNLESLVPELVKEALWSRHRKNVTQVDSSG